jgi:hypothetical protein
MEKYTLEDLRRMREELEHLIQWAETEADFARLDRLLADAEQMTTPGDLFVLRLRAKNRKRFIQGPPPEPPRKPGKRREPDAVDRLLVEEGKRQRRQEALERQEGREYEAQQQHRGNMIALSRVFSNPHEQVDLRKVRGRMARAMARMPEDKAADLMRRYEEFAAKVQKLREV